MTFQGNGAKTRHVIVLTEDESEVHQLAKEAAIR